MKKILIVFILLGIFSCKNKKDETPDPEPVTPAPLKTSAMMAKVNGQPWLVLGNQTATANIAQSVYNGTPKQYVVAGRTDPTLNKHSIQLGFAYTTGTVNLEFFSGNFYAYYYDSTGTSYPVKTGTMNITTIDTSHVKSTACDKFKATFSFVTSAIAGKSYTVTEGSVDFEAN